jgi:hypothetical protein
MGGRFDIGPKFSKSQTKSRAIVRHDLNKHVEIVPTQQGHINILPALVITLKFVVRENVLAVVAMR